jgi:hypothetical protein
VVVAVQQHRQAEPVDDHGERGGAGRHRDPQPPVVRADQGRLRGRVTRHPGTTFADGERGAPDGEQAGQQTHDGPLDDGGPRGRTDPVELGVGVVPQRDQVAAGLLVAGDQPVPVR